MEDFMDYLKIILGIGFIVSLSKKYLKGETDEEVREILDDRYNDFWVAIDDLEVLAKKLKSGDEKSRPEYTTLAELAKQSESGYRQSELEYSTIAEIGIRLGSVIFELYDIVYEKSEEFKAKKQSGKVFYFLFFTLD
jgi:hypothetical protein